MKPIFENAGITYDVKGKYQLHVDGQGVTYITAKGKITDVKFADVEFINVPAYCTSNQHYTVYFVEKDKQQMPEIDTDVLPNPDYNNVIETKTILVAYAENKLTRKFPDNIDELDLTLGVTLTRKTVRIKNGVLTNGKKQIRLSDIRRAVCVVGTILVYTTDKGAGGFFKKIWDTPDMKIPANEISLPVLEAVIAKNTGNVIDFTRVGNGFDQKTCEFVLTRYMNSTFFANEDGSVTDDWHKIAYDHIASYHADIKLPGER